MRPPPAGGLPGTPVRREDPVVIAARRAQFSRGNDRVAGGDLERHPVPCALPREPHGAPRRVPGHVVGDETASAFTRVASLTAVAAGSPFRITRSPPSPRSSSLSTASDSARNRARFGGTASAGSTTNSGSTARARADAPASAGLSRTRRSRVNSTTAASTAPWCRAAARKVHALVRKDHKHQPQRQARLPALTRSA